ncbi:uncharacterized protein At4g22160 [Tasmannia lanceolata]|uniref:uncharacterized protein At4g22160 n=1 Tax=Tasmannia lanceolata TaxID=3420 RepID=UPI00406482CF
MKNPLNRNDGGLPYAFDSGFVSGARPSDTLLPLDSESDSSGDSCGAHLAETVRAFSEFLLRREMEEIERVKATEALRAESERRRSESETQITELILNTQLQIATCLSSKQSRNRKRKRVREEEDQDGEESPSAPDEMWDLLMLGFIQCNFRF